MRKRKTKTHRHEARSEMEIDVILELSTLEELDLEEIVSRSKRQHPKLMTPNRDSRRQLGRVHQYTPEHVWSHPARQARYAFVAQHLEYRISHYRL
jgi:hypothetical protein